MTDQRHARVLSALKSVHRKFEKDMQPATSTAPLPRETPTTRTRPIAVDEPLERYINQNGVKPGPVKLAQFIRAMKLRDVPALYSQDGKGQEAIVHVKLFDPCGSKTWFVTEFDGSNDCFGIVDNGHEREHGYFSLSEMSAVRGRMGIGIEIDVWHRPLPLKEIRARK